MRFPKHVIGSLLLLLSFLVGCGGNGDALLATAMPTASVKEPAEQPAGRSENTPPPTYTPAAAAPLPTATVANAPETPLTAATDSPVPPLPVEQNNDLEAIDTALQEIDNSMCREAHEARAEIDEMLAQGADVADLEAAIVELIEELENCSLEATPGP